MIRQQQKFVTLILRSSFLFGLIDKPAHAEYLIDRFCSKFMITKDPKISMNVGYCLTLIKYTAKSLARLHENYGYYKDQLRNTNIYNIFKHITTTVKKSKNADMQVSFPNSRFYDVVCIFNFQAIAEEMDANIESMYNSREERPIAKACRKGKKRQRRAATPRVPVNSLDNPQPSTSSAPY